MKKQYIKFVKLAIWLTCFFFLGRFSVSTQQEIIDVEAVEPPKIVLLEQQAILEPKTEQKLLKEEIKEVFGKHYEDAMTLLTHKDCHENLSLDPKVIHTNEDGSLDLGLFQINEHWQGFNHIDKAKQFLLDPHINIRIAWRLYEDAGYSFNAWTCGKVLSL
jgi:hypothetical protein